VSGLLIRAAGLPLAGTGDVTVWKTWSYAASKDVATMYGVGGIPPVRGVVTWGTHQMTVDYPPAALYGLALVGLVYRAVDPAFSDGRLFTIVLKAAILLSDAAICAGLWILVRRRWSEAAARAAARLYLLIPGAIMDGAVLGYVDPWAGCLTVGALLAMDAAAFATSGAVVALAVLTKPQTVLLIPVAALFLLRRSGRDWWKAALVASSTAMATTALVLAPFARIGALPNVRQGVGSLLRHDMLSGEAANVGWIATWLLRASYATHDMGAWAAWTMRIPILGISRVTALGYPNPRPIAALAAGSVIGWAFWRARRAPAEILLAAGALAVHAYFTLEVQVHENHLLLALPLLAGAAAVLSRLRGPLYLVSAVFTLNLFLFQGFGRDFGVPSRGFTIVDATVVLSFVNVRALVWHARRFAQVTASYNSPRTQPPSTGSVTPVTNEAAGEARNAMTAPNSSGVPIRPSGILSTIRCSA
jgi:hypothetical protein